MTGIACGQGQGQRSQMPAVSVKGIGGRPAERQLGHDAVEVAPSVRIYRLERRRVQAETAASRRRKRVTQYSDRALPLSAPRGWRTTGRAGWRSRSAAGCVRPRAPLTARRGPGPATASDPSSGRADGHLVGQAIPDKRWPSEPVGRSATTAATVASAAVTSETAGADACVDRGEGAIQTVEAAEGRGQETEIEVAQLHPGEMEAGLGPE
jgi:hypothetical protein